MDTMIGYQQCTKSINYFKSASGWPPKSYAFSRFGSLRQIYNVFPQIIFATMCAILNHLVMQHLVKNQLFQFDPIVNIVSNLAAWTIIERYMTEEAKKKEDNLKKRMHPILLNKSIGQEKKGLTYMDKTTQGPMSKLYKVLPTSW
jgi:hypothetical protein